MSNSSDHRITIRLKPDEYALLTGKSGNKPLGTFMRELALEDAAKRRQSAVYAPIRDQKGLAQVLGLLGQNDLVRAFKRAEQGVKDGVQPGDEETKLLLRECRQLLASIHTLLMRALGVAER